jgi:bifunctional enzyme CysN/CysC
MDLVGYDQARFEQIQTDYTGFVAKLGVPDVTFIPMSALRGDNVVDRSEAMPWYDGRTLLHHLETVHIASDRNLSELRFPVQYVLRPNLDFRGFAGTVASGIIRKGDEVVALPSGKRSTVRSIVTYDGELEEAFAPQAVTVTLADEIDVSRGDVLVHPKAQPHVSSTVEAMVVWMGEKPLVAGRTYWVKHTTRTVTAEVAEFRYNVDVNTLETRPATQLGLNEVGHVVLSLTQPIAADPYRLNPATGAFVIIDRLTNNTVGAGMIQERSDGRRDGGDLWGQQPVIGRREARRSLISPADREARLGQRGFTVLIYGLPASGKATLAYALEKQLFDAGRTVTVLYGPDMRQGLGRDLGFTADDRSENLRRSAEVAKLLNDAGIICVCAFVAPHDAVRKKAREVVGADRFVEVYLKCPVDVCKRRDETGAYQAAEAGRMVQFPGVSATYEEPGTPDLVIDTERTPARDAAADLLRFLGERLLAPKR